MAIRVLLDTNVFVGHLLGSTRTGSTVGRVFDAVLTGAVELILPQVIEDEVREKIRAKPALASIDLAETERFLAGMRFLAVATPAEPLAAAAVVRDHDDDIILAYAIAEAADFLVTGDKDLLVLADAFAPLKIRSPLAFVAELERGGSA